MTIAEGLDTILYTQHCNITRSRYHDFYLNTQFIIPLCALMCHQLYDAFDSHTLSFFCLVETNGEVSDINVAPFLSAIVPGIAVPLATVKKVRKFKYSLRDKSGSPVNGKVLYS